MSSSRFLPDSRFGTASQATTSISPIPWSIADGKSRNAIQFVRVRGQLEVFINERRVLYQPILPDVLLERIQFQVVGASVDVSEFILNELIPRLPAQ